MNAVKVFICSPCAEKLRVIQEKQGKSAAIDAMGRTLCRNCRTTINRMYGKPDDAEITFKRIPQA